MANVVVDQSKCNAGCGACVTECSEEVFGINASQKAYVKDDDACLGKAACEEYCLSVCQPEAITINKA